MQVSDRRPSPGPGTDCHDALSGSSTIGYDLDLLRMNIAWKS